MKWSCRAFDWMLQEVCFFLKFDAFSTGLFFLPWDSENKFQKKGFFFPLFFLSLYRYYNIFV